MVQKITGEIIILIRLTKPVPTGFNSTANFGAARPTTMAATTATITARYRKWVRSDLFVGFAFVVGVIRAAPSP